MSASLAAPREAAAARWDLTVLHTDDAGALESMDEVIARAKQLAGRYRGRVGTLTAPALARAIDEYADAQEWMVRASAYAALRVYENRVDPSARDLQGAMTTKEDEAEGHLRFFVLEIARLDDRAARKLLKSKALSGRRHWISKQRRRGRHLLSESEEAALAVRTEAAEACWSELHQTVLGRLQFEVQMAEGSEEVTIGLSQAASLVRHPQRLVRHSLMRGLGEALEPVSEILAQCYDSRVADRLAVDHLRGFVEPMDSAHQANELERGSVEALLASVQQHYSIPQAWFVAKARHLGLETLDLADLYAPLGRSDLEVSWSEAISLVGEAFGRFSPEAKEIACGLLDGQVDAGPRRGKKHGAFTLPTGTRGLPFIMLSFDGQMRQVGSLAHELGHGVHRVMSAGRRDVLDYGIGTAIAEIPSTFFDLLTRDVALERIEDPVARAALRCSLLEDTFAAVFRQTQMTVFEEGTYRARAQGLHLSADRLGDLWTETMGDYLGTAVRIPHEGRLGWSYVPHFIAARFYTYSYSFAHLCARTLHARWREDPKALAPLITSHLLERGGSAPPEEILRDLGLDITSDGFWAECLDEVRAATERAIADLELLARP